MHRLRFHKGHGTMNDFIMFTDSEGFTIMDPKFIAALTHRRTGIGADGIIRAVRAGVMQEWDGDPDLWFMDYYNADGTVAELCGNGLRVFGIYLMQQQLVSAPDFDVATRAGLKHISVDYDSIAAEIGTAKIFDDPVTITTRDGTWDAVPVELANPHAVVFVDQDQLPELHLDRAPEWKPEDRFPQGANIEFVSIIDDNHLSMRFHERGSGETMSCGTGVVAAASAHRARNGVEGPVHVQVPGGNLRVDFDGNVATLVGQAVITGDGTFWL